VKRQLHGDKATARICCQSASRQRSPKVQEVCPPCNTPKYPWSATFLPRECLIDAWLCSRILMSSCQMGFAETTAAEWQQGCRPAGIYLHIFRLTITQIALACAAHSRCASRCRGWSGRNAKCACCRERVLSLPANQEGIMN